MKTAPPTDEERPTLTIEEAWRMPHDELRRRFSDIATLLYSEYGTTMFGEDISVLRYPSQLTTTRMLELLKAHPPWFAPEELRHFPKSDTP